MISRISSKSCCPIRRRRIVHSRSTNPDLSERLNVTPALFAVYLNLFFLPLSSKAVNGYGLYYARFQTKAPCDLVRETFILQSTQGHGKLQRALLSDTYSSRLAYQQDHQAGRAN